MKYNIQSNVYPRKHSVPRDREFIWTAKGKCLKDLGTYQPEDDGYEVGYVRQGKYCSTSA